MHRGQLHTLLQVGVIPTPATNLSSKFQAPSSGESPITKHQSDRRYTLPYPVLSVRGEIIITLRFERRVCGWESCRMHQV